MTILRQFISNYFKGWFNKLTISGEISFHPSALNLQKDGPFWIDISDIHQVGDGAGASLVHAMP